MTSQVAGLVCKCCSIKLRSGVCMMSCLHLSKPMSHRAYLFGLSNLLLRGTEWQQSFSFQGGCVIEKRQHFEIWGQALVQNISRNEMKMKQNVERSHLKRKTVYGMFGTTVPWRRKFTKLTLILWASLPWPSTTVKSSRFFGMIGTKCVNPECSY